MKIKLLLLSLIIISSMKSNALLNNVLVSECKGQIYSQSVLGNEGLGLMFDDFENNNNIFLNSDSINYRKQVLNPCISLQWGINNDGSFIDEMGVQSTQEIDVNADKAWDKYTGKKEVIIAIIDTGIDFTHEDLRNVIWTNQGETAGDGIDNDNNGFIDDIHGWNFYDNSCDTYNSQSDEDDHGTHVAGIIAALRNNIGIAGVASNTNIKIMTIKILGSRKRNGSINSFIEAIEYAESMGASICNISSGTYLENTKLKSAIENSEMLFVTAAGNGGENNDITPMYPASFDLENIISVASISCNGSLNSLSNFGKTSVDIAAPGSSILSTLTNDRYGYLSGTSMAAPFVTGVIAMVYSYYEDITLLDAKAIVLNSVKKLPTLEGKVLSGGIPNALAALSYNNEAIVLIHKIVEIVGSLQRYLTMSLNETPLFKDSSMK
jgi:subtilisin family serine protease